MTQIPALRAENTHLYPGARLHAEDAAGTVPDSGDVVLVFSDHIHAEARFERQPDGFTLQVEPYTTGAGTDIPARSWYLTEAADRCLRVSARH